MMWRWCQDDVKMMWRWCQDDVKMMSTWCHNTCYFPRISG